MFTKITIISVLALVLLGALASLIFHCILYFNAGKLLLENHPVIFTIVVIVMTLIGAILFGIKKLLK